MRPATTASAVLFFLAASTIRSAEHKLEGLKEPVPPEVDASIKKEIEPEGFRVIDPRGKPLADLWLRKEIPPSPPPKEPPAGLKFPAVAEGTLLGIVRYHRKHTDFKDKPIFPGTYTLRLGVLPNDGDHLNVSKTRDFAILCPAGADRSLAPSPTPELVKLSIKGSGTKHPSVVWLQPMDGERKGFPALVPQPDLDYQVIDFKLPLKGEKEKPVRMGLVIVGTAPEA